MDYTFKNMFLTFYILQVGPPNVAGLRVTFPPILPLNGLWCDNNVLINALKKSTQCVNAFKKLML